MLHDLVVAFLAAGLVVLAPGWFWAATLFRTEGLFERLVLSMGFSLALTAAVAYVPARGFDLGVTLAVAIFSPAFVFVTGLALYLIFGSPAGRAPTKSASPGAAVPAALRPARKLGLLALVPLLPAALVMLGWNATLLTGALWVYVAGGLVAASGLAYLLFSVGTADGKGGALERDDPPPEPGSASSGGWVKWVTVPAVFLLVLVRAYIGPVLQDWPFVQGVDHYSHAVMANLMQSRGGIFPYLIYPPGFHTVTAMVSRISDLRPLDVFPVLAPALFLLPALSLYVLGKRLWGWQYGALAALFAGVVANGPYIFYNDAMYPNLVTSEFLIVLAVTALVALYNSPSWRTGLAVALLGSAPVFFHQVASLYTALLLALVAVYVLPYLLFRNRKAGLALFFSFALLGPLAVAYAWDTYNLTQVISEYLGAGGASNTGSAVGQAVGTQFPYSLRDAIGAVFTAPVAFLGLLGVFVLFSGMRREPAAGESDDGSQVATRATVLIWTLVLCVGALTSLSGFPQRFAQDLVLPLSLLSALATVTVARTLVSTLKNGLSGPSLRNAGVAASAALLLFTGGLASYWAVRNLEPDGGPAVQLSYAKTLTITPKIAAAGEWLRQNNNGGYIMVSPQSNQVPSRMMLAMGEYPGYQSFTYQQLVLPRDLPPGGAEPLWEVLWVMNFPNTERAQEIIRERDVRYLVLYKYMPDRGITPFYRRFEQAPNLYQNVFENSDVLIVRLRDNPEPPLS